MAHLAGFIYSQFNDALGAGGKAGSGGGCLFSWTDNILHGGTHFGEADTHIYQHTGGYTLLFLNQPQQYVLGAYVVVVKALGFFLSQAKNTAGSL
jgi:hypothetical protein